MRPPIATIAAPPLPSKGAWLRGGPPPDGAPVLVEFWDCCRAHSMRTLPYLEAWHERYAADGLAIVGVHCPGFEPSAHEETVLAAIARLRIGYAVLHDPRFEVWAEYENPGWPARYLWDARGALTHYHHGEGAYDETELAIQELLAVKRELLAPRRPEDVPGARVAPPSPERTEPPWSGPYEAGGVWAVLSGSGSVNANGSELNIRAPGAYPLIEHERHTSGMVELELGQGVRCHALTFTPGAL